MKCAVVFLVLFMVILMAQPGECIFGFLLNGALHVGRLIHRLVTRRRGMEDEVVALDKRSFEYNPGRPDIIENWMKFVMIFLVLSMVVLMAEPGEGFIGSLFRGAVRAFRGVRRVWRAHRGVSRYAYRWRPRPVRRVVYYQPRQCVNGYVRG
ncbi:uncharacterized protein LOC143336641 [Chaetodon auriga]|uniref:uncharacterized protein LOC143336641 n=1 Tax=Chaetodon auriga TaxID=39042 RepID=UPI00403294DE